MKHGFLNFRILVCAFALALSVTPALRAAEPNLSLADEQRATALSHELRCMVCQNQSIEDSDAPLARDLRQLVREKIALGESDTVIKNDLVARYGEFILLNPAFEPSTYLLWGAPVVALLIGFALAWRWIKNQRFEA